MINGQCFGQTIALIILLSAPVSSKPVNSIFPTFNFRRGLCPISIVRYIKVVPVDPKPPCLLFVFLLGHKECRLGNISICAMRSPGEMTVIPFGEETKAFICPVKSGSITPGCTISPFSVEEPLPSNSPTLFCGIFSCQSVSIICTPISGVSMSLEVAQMSNPALPEVALRSPSLWEDTTVGELVELPRIFVAGPGEGPVSRFFEV